MELSKRIFDAGVVGAGGAGFPTQVKAKSKVEFVLANGAECEPLIHKDVELMKNFAPQIVEGMNLMLDSTSAKKGYFGIKEKNVKAIEKVENEIHDSRIELSLLGDYYPSGDEYELVYAATGRLIPAHGIPLQIGCVVNNVETFYNISNAVKGIPVTEKFVCVTGAVKNPKTFFAPVGISIGELIELAGGTKLKDFAVFVSGILMGKLTFDLNEVVTKTTAGIIVLPKDHYLVQRMERPVQDMNRIGKSACDQCSYCTEFCPRYLLGYDVQPHKVMRTLSFSASGSEVWNQYADLCCSCGLCSLYSCPEDLYPREACDQGKVEMRKLGIKYEQPKPVKVHPIKEGRRVPLKQLMKRLNVLQYNAPTPFENIDFEPKEVTILLKQHTGKSADSAVAKGEFVKKGQLIASVNESELGANIHSSINGTVEEITGSHIKIVR
ncbi:MAG: 4Fe-4S dicluster domain-containing protein [Bacteroidetes bacterium]|nr:4Fe-4S dicluster domain-containing protein [Bacteroidota bacterium]MBU1677461.1 4Fe-4S dicluster domain-containing protein [Bacteroidota bacterium]MBU2505279.1 4Fe-4S dicluster domain-containing protein [Bacteroidota bacterium]